MPLATALHSQVLSSKQGLTVMDCERMSLSNRLVSTQASKREPRVAVGAPTLRATRPAFRGRVHKITRTTRRVLSDPADVEDIAQQTFSPDCRTVPVMHYFTDLSYGQIASCLEPTDAAIKSRLLCTRRQMALVLKHRFCGGHTKRQSLILSRCPAADCRHSIRRLDEPASKYEA